MELSQRDRLSELVEELTTSGQQQISREKMKEIKKICKESIDGINHVYHSIMSRLNKDHAEIRLAAFNLATEIFPKSHHFRTVLLDNFQEFLELTVEINFERPLPPPLPVSRKLQSLAIQTIQSWHSFYGSAYKRLELGYQFLKQFKKVEIEDAQARAEEERVREAESQKNMKRTHKERLEAVIKDMEETTPDIEMALKELNSCLMLLFPQFSLFNIQTPNSFTKTTTGCLSDDPHCSTNLVNDITYKIQENKNVRNNFPNYTDNAEHLKVNKTKSNKRKRRENQEVNKRDGHDTVELESYKMKHNENEGCEVEEQDPLHGDSFIRHFGLMSRTYSLDLNLSFHVEETDDNEAVISTLIDLQRLLITKHLPAVRYWVQIFTRSGGELDFLTRALELKRSLESSSQKFSQLNIKFKSGIKKMAASFEDEEDDTDFIEVSEKEGNGSHIPLSLQVKNVPIPWTDCSTRSKVSVMRPRGSSKRRAR
ncbi:UV-stimulated scaffold protein A isoform X2 [Stigmatopora nigra]